MGVKQKQERIFGTDGIRGLANSGPLEVSRVLKLGEASARLLRRGNQAPRVGLGWDTRISSEALASALAAGLSGGGAEVLRFGVLPTPAVSQLTLGWRLSAGIVVSASHNPAEDNGIKYFSAAGEKLPDALERKIESACQADSAPSGFTGTRMGAILEQAAPAREKYAARLVRLFAGQGLDKLRVAADLAQGAACVTAPEVFTRLGLKASWRADRPDGRNINQQCGSLHPRAVAGEVRKLGAHAGMAFDGDADRVMLVDEQGRVVNGDRVLGALALHYAKNGRLRNRTVVVTVMSNLGLELYLKAKEIRVLRTTVGDRHVARAMRQAGAVLGGEQSGHILLPRLAPTGDGLITALEMLAVMRREGRPLSELVSGWKDFPQVLVNVRVKQRPDLTRLPGVAAELRAARKKLGARGRVNVRYSGTEPLARIMVEAEHSEWAESWGLKIADRVEESIGAGQRRTLTWLTCA